MSAIQEIKQILRELSPRPFKVRLERVNGVEAPTELIAADGTKLVSKEAGLCYGAGGDIDDQIDANARFLSLSPIYMDVLVRALERATGGNTALQNDLLNHAYKEVLGELRLIEIPPVLFKK